jgi:CHRD domain-containing protein
MDMLRKSLAIVLVLTTVSPAMAAQTALKSALAGASGGSGTATFMVDPDKGEVCYELSVSGIEAVKAAHIHKGAAGANGPPVVMLDAPATGSSKGCASPGADVAKALIADPAGYYVNVHTAAAPGGAIRGQLSK